jgi:hypothetical protein
MSTDLVKIEHISTAIAAAAKEEGASELGKLLKFSKGHYFVATDEIPLGKEFISHVEHWTRGWVKFKNGSLVEHRVGRVADGFIVPPREKLDDLDESKWENEADGRPKDPWAQQSYVPLEDCETGEIVTFVSGSSGGRGAISKLAARAARHLATMGQPRIKLAVESYKHRAYGRIEKPSFIIVGWTNEISQPPARDFGATDRNNFDDSIPF